MSSPVDSAALELLRATGIYFDQEQITPAEDLHELVLAGSATSDELAEAIAAFMRDGRSALAVDAMSSPIRLYEVSGVTSPILAIADGPADVRQVEPERDAIAAALRRASSGTAAHAATSEMAPPANDAPQDDTTTRPRLGPGDQPESRRTRWLAPLATPAGVARRYLGHPQISHGVTAASLLGATIAGRLRRWLGIAALVSAVATVADLVVSQRRRRGQQDEAERTVS
ncbi:MAG: hypothetical protein O3A10_16290 [Chloroflexi bacterium]|nr:hypothetical protein [Chloroflexota bacterium]